MGAASLAGCGATSGAAVGDPAAPIVGPAFTGTYDVPTVTPDLAAAAHFAVAEVGWEVVGTTARLAYRLPVDLVGKTVRVDFVGTIDPATGVASLTGPAGTSQCTVTPTSLTCQETMRGLLPLQPDLQVVANRAAASGQTIAQRVQVAQVFSTDPIGVVKADLRSPASARPAEDNGKGKAE